MGAHPFYRPLSRRGFSSVWIFVDSAEIAKKSQRRRTVAYDTAAASTKSTWPDDRLAASDLTDQAGQYASSPG